MIFGTRCVALRWVVRGTELPGRTSRTSFGLLAAALRVFVVQMARGRVAYSLQSGDQQLQVHRHRTSNIGVHGVGRVIAEPERRSRDSITRMKSESRDLMTCSEHPYSVFKCVCRSRVVTSNTQSESHLLAIDNIVLSKSVARNPLVYVTHAPRRPPRPPGLLAFFPTHRRIPDHPLRTLFLIFILIDFNTSSSS